MKKQSLGFLMGCIFTIGIASIYSFTSNETQQKEGKWYRIDFRSDPSCIGSFTAIVWPVNNVSQKDVDRAIEMTLSSTHVGFGEGILKGRGELYVKY
jgi:hypothetical protein